MARVPGLSTATILWFIIGGVTVILDALFVINRPASLTTEDYPFKAWQLYAKTDKRYSDTKDPWCLAQTYLNFVEVALQFLAVLLSLANVRLTAQRIALVVSIMTLYKTITYFVIEHFEEYKYTKHNTGSDLFLIVAVPTAFWFIMPAYVIVKAFGALSASGASDVRSVESKKGK
jgi:hypothetical protein